MTTKIVPVCSLEPGDECVVGFDRNYGVVNIDSAFVNGTERCIAVSVNSDSALGGTAVGKYHDMEITNSKPFQTWRYPSLEKFRASQGAHEPRWRTIENISDVAYGMWICGDTLVEVDTAEAREAAKLNESIHGILPIIKAKDIQEGDLICWGASGNVLYHALVSSIQEHEFNDTAHIIVYGTVYSSNIRATKTKVTTKHTFMAESAVMLVMREE